MYSTQYHHTNFTHSLRIEALPVDLQEFTRAWALGCDRDERLHYDNGEFFIVVPFEMLLRDNIEFEALCTLTRRLNRLYELHDADGIIAHSLAYPYVGWRHFSNDFQDYLDMLLFLYHLKMHLPLELYRPSTLAIYVHD